MTEYPNVADSYAAAVRALRLIDIGGRDGHREGTALLMEMGDAEASRVLVMIARDLASGVARLAECDKARVWDEMALNNADDAEEWNTDD